MKQNGLLQSQNMDYKRRGEIEQRDKQQLEIELQEREINRNKENKERLEKEWMEREERDLL